ncbi:MAG: hypothetical protein KTR29_17365 [Rhodothermaceae bacterium]|nr:hypothetical protein [Rhodothermaceae bacterium]
MRSSLLLPILFVFLAACNTTERVVHFDSEQSSVAQLSANDVNALQSKYGNADGVYLKYNETLEHNVSIAFTSTIPHWKFYKIVDRSYAVFNTASPELSAFTLEVDDEDKLEQATIQVQVPGSLGTTYTKDDLTVQTGADGQKVYSLSYSIAEPGTIVSERYEITMGDLERNPPVAHDVPLQYSLPAEQVRFQYIYPIWWQVDIKNLSLNQPLEYERIEDSERRKIILTYSNESVPAFVETQNGPYFKQSAPYFQLQVTNLSMGSALRYNAPEDWTEFAKDYKQYAVGEGDRAARSIQRTTENLVGPASSDLDRVEIILNYIKDNIVLVDNNKQKSFDLVLSRREGNTYMITGLMQSMLNEAGIDSEFLLIHPAYEGYFDPDFYSEDQLQEPALGVFVDGEQYYVLPGRQRSLGEALPRYFAGQTAMVITEEGFGGFTEVFGGQGGGGDLVAVADNTMTPPNTPVSDVPSNSGVTQQTPVETMPDTNTGTSTTVDVTPPPISTGGAPGINTPVNVPTDPVQGDPVDVVSTEPPVNQQPVVTEPAPTGPEWEGSIKTSLGGFSWVVASRTTLEEAHELANEYAALYRAGISVDVLRGESRGVVRYRIAIGQYTSRSLAEEDKTTRLNTVLPSDAWLLRIEPTM